ncbi:MAG: UDP-N-acetylmuramoyl-tripeptide--D-alanyl-D-alanine ligase [Bacteroidales bacterium]|jgi:UDP-N-acetylmuramoyl-tripeptide--D-alanyl-D-alanine ligase|nr:UDP-N-acetylmuramoyl-tripeptide--D-alanyl-D-alanine ligase [Bacteroidales bacterium]
MTVESLYSKFKVASGVTTDSRNCPKGSLFFALKGVSFNGNLYAEMALSKGCSYVVVDEEAVVIDERFILVDDVLTALQLLANYHRKCLGTPIIGITGSNGKTTTKELLAAVLSQKFNLHYTQGNFNNHIGVPLTLLLLKQDHEMAIIEMGANHSGEIQELCAIAEPDMGMITNIGKAHLEGFGGIEGVSKTKKELYEFMRSTEGKLFVNGADDLLMSLSEGIERSCYNAGNSAFDVSVAGSIPALSLKVIHGAVEGVIQTQMVGEYNSINVAAVLEIGKAFDIPYEKMKTALEAYVPSNNRSQILTTEKNRIILDAYNANPASMGLAIENFITLDVPHKVVLLGAMKELGKYSKDEHQAIINAISGDVFQLKMVVGEEFSEVDSQGNDVVFFKTLDEVKTYLKEQALEASTILVKGSRSMKMETLVELL